jgi:hypothetical protein
MQGTSLLLVELQDEYTLEVMLPILQAEEKLY